MFPVGIINLFFEQGASNAVLVFGLEEVGHVSPCRRSVANSGSHTHHRIRQAHKCQARPNSNLDESCAQAFKAFP
jgi:hypothetical protein